MASRPLQQHQDLSLETTGMSTLNLRPHFAGARRRLIVGCDGTWVNSDQDNSKPSNITRLCRSLNTNDFNTRSAASYGPTYGEGEMSPNSDRSNKPDQIVFYHRGIGTDGDLEDRLIGGGTGSDLSEHIRECYSFLATNYQPGDEIFIFGFSRGAYTARAISSLVHDVGLLTSIGMEFFYEVFEDWKNQNVPVEKEKDRKMDGDHPVEKGAFKGLPARPEILAPEYTGELARRNYTRPNIPIKVVGVWDTVGALGIPPIFGINLNDKESLQYSFVNTKVSQCVEHAFQALAMDDHRYVFAPAVWEQPDAPHRLKSLRQCWFPGVHSNIGGAGGYQDQTISNITLAWMIKCLQEVPDGPILDLDQEYLSWVFNRDIEWTEDPDSKCGGFRGWALGRIEETLTLFYSIAGAPMAGKHKRLMDYLRPGDVPRTPGRYCELDASSGKMVSTGRLLRGTNEKIHPSVRVRVKCGGKGLDDKVPYHPVGLRGWSIMWTGAGKDGATGGGGGGNEKDPLSRGFVWVGEGNDGKEMVLEEEEVRGFEVALLRCQVEALRVETRDGRRV